MKSKSLSKAPKNRPSCGGGGGVSSSSSKSSPPNEDFESQLRGLWEHKEVENGMIRAPERILEALIRKEDISSLYDVNERPVASGLFATVRTCVHKETGITYAAKFSSRFRNGGADFSSEVLHEIAMLSLCNSSSHIVHLRDVFQNRAEIILVLEYAPGGDFQHVLDDDMVPFEEDVISYMVQVLEALQFLHDRSVAHLDIKPQNIVLMGRFPNCEIKLCDLEVARVIQEDEEIREIIGTPDYVAPEIISMDPITLASDIWSVGVLAYVLLTGFSPFGGENDQDTLRNITSGILDFPHELFEGVSDAAKDFIRGCLKKDAKVRPTVSECLKNPWLVSSSEPPSPSPLMLKIPTPDPPPSRHCPRRSACLNRTTERKRYLSKSREALYEKVAANSNLKKSLSTSKERLVVDLSLSLSKQGKTGRRKTGGRSTAAPAAASSTTPEKPDSGQATLPQLPEEEESSVKNRPWRSELAKYASKPSRVAELIGSFDSRVAGGRRGSLQMNLVDSLELKPNAKPANSAVNSSSPSPKELKLQRRKSASAIPPLRLTPTGLLLEPEPKKTPKTGRTRKDPPHKGNSRLQEGKKKPVLVLVNINKSEPPSEGPLNGTPEEPKSSTPASERKAARGKVNKKWDYFESFDHPKAISDKKLQQLKAKYARKEKKPEKPAKKKEEKESVVSSKVIPSSPKQSASPAPEIQEHSHPSQSELSKGVVVVAEPSGSVVVAEPSGSVVVAEPSGSVVVAGHSGSVVVAGHSGSVLLPNAPPSLVDCCLSIPDNAFLEVIVNPLTSVISTKTVHKGGEPPSNTRRYSSPLFTTCPPGNTGSAASSSTPPQKVRSNSITADLSFLNPVHRMCNGAFSRALERYSLATSSSGGTHEEEEEEEEEAEEEVGVPSEERSSSGSKESLHLRRRSSPTLKTS